MPPARCHSLLLRSKVAVRSLALSCCVLSGFSLACGAATRPAPAALPVPPPVPIEPVPPPEPEPQLRADLAAPPAADGSALESEWQARHEAQLRTPGRSAAQLVLLGDSLANGWFASRAFQKQWAKRKPLNLALDGDQTQQLLWRLEHGALAGLSPRLVIVSVGSENLTHGFSPAQISEGVRAVLQRIAEQLPASQVLLLALLPRGISTADPLRVAADATNAGLRRLGNERITVVDTGSVFLEGDGRLTPDVMADPVHLNPLGYEALSLSVSLVAERLLQGVD